MTQVYIIKYDVHCKLENFFNKETKVKNCESELHAKVKLNEYVKKKYGAEFTHIIIKSCIAQNTFTNDIFKQFGDIFNSKKK